MSKKIAIKRSKIKKRIRKEKKGGTKS